MSTRWLNDSNAALFTDLYQLTMLQAYFNEGMDQNAVFDLFIRRLKNRNYFLACGLDTALHYLENLHFNDECIDYLSEQGQFKDDFLDYLKDFTFEGDIYAMPEGTPVFPEEPILEVDAPIGQAQLAETFLLNQITFQTGIASKANRVVLAAEGRTVADFGMRRMHGGDAALKGARAEFIAGVHATSNVLAGMQHDLPITGTMAHSYVEAHPTEIDAFRNFAKLYPDTTLLVDTYDTPTGVDKVIELSEELGDAFQIGAIRLDSGDLVELAFDARERLDAAGLNEVQIFASGGLDEWRIAEFVDAGAPIDGFGVGTNMGTMADNPALDSAYKLSGYAGKPRMKLATDKSNLPGRKQVYRRFKNGKAAGDVIATADEDISDAKPLLHKVMENGERIDEAPSLDECRTHCEEAVSQLPDRLLSLEEADSPYPVSLSDNLSDRLKKTRERLEKQMM